MSTLNLGHHSWHDYVSTAAKRITQKGAYGSDDRSTESDDGDFFGTPTLQHAVNLAINGWQEGAKAIAKTLDSLPPSQEVLPDWMLDVAGSIVNVPAFITGEPECMWRMSECKRNEHRVTLVIPGTYSGGVNQAGAQRYATAIAAVVRALEASGINPAVYSMPVSIGHGGRGDRVISSISVREFGEPLDLAKVAMAFHPSFLRRIQFAWREITPAAASAGIGGDGYGRADVPTREEITSLLGDVGYVVLVPKVETAIRASGDVIQYIRDSVSAQLKTLM